MSTLSGMEEFWARRWQALVYAALLGVVFSANYTNHGPLVSTLVKEWGISLSVAGFLTTAIFATHGLLQIPGGALADRFGAKNVGTFGLIIITLCNIAAGFAASINYLLVCKFLCGIGTGCAFIGGLRYVPTFFHGKEIQRAQGVYGGSILLGSGFVIYGIPQILHAVGWRAVFFTTGGMAGALLLIWLFFAPATPAHHKVAKINWNDVLGNRNIWLLAFAQLASFGTVIAAGVWVNTLLTKSLGIPPKTAGMIGSTILLLGIVIRPLGGMILGHRLLSPKKLIAYSTVGLSVGYWMISQSTSLPMAFGSIILAGVMSGLPFAGIFNAARENCPTNPGVAMGFVNTWGAVAVMAFPPIIGRLVDVSGTFVSGFYLLAVVTLLSGLCSFFLTSKEQEQATRAVKVVA